MSLKDTSFLAILSLGFALAFTTGELDLSVADIASLAAVIAGWLVHKNYDPLLAVFGCARARRAARRLQRLRASRCCAYPR